MEPIVMPVDITIWISSGSPTSIGVNIAGVAPIVIWDGIWIASPMRLDIRTVSPDITPHIYIGK
jgi:hypothetical protein